MSRIGTRSSHNGMKLGIIGTGNMGQALGLGWAEELGFVGIDWGALERAQLVEAVGDFIRFQIIGMGLGPFATISLDVASAR